MIDECIFRHRLYGYDGTALVKRSIFTYYGNGAHQPMGIQHRRPDHGPPHRDRRPGEQLRERHPDQLRLLRDNAPVWQSNGVTMTNNLCVSPNLTSNTTPGATIITC